MEMEKMNYKITEYELDGERKTFIHKEDESYRLFDFMNIVKSFDEEEGTDYASRVDVISEDLITSEFVDAPMVKRRAIVSVPVTAYYPIEVVMDVPKYGNRALAWEMIRERGERIAYNNIDTDRVNLDHLYHIHIDHRADITEYGMRELEVEEEEDEEEEC